MALVSLDGLLACLGVTEVEPGRFTAPHLDLDYHRIFGGQLLAQAVVIAEATGEGKSVKSLACLFPREGRTDQPVDLRVERAHDGRSFAARRLTATQEGRAFFLADVSLHAEEDGLEHQAPVDGLPHPDGPPPEDATEVELSMIPWQTRVIDTVDLADPAVGPPTFAFWMRVADRRLSDRIALHQALLAHATDLTVIGTALRPHPGYSQGDAGGRLATAVTSHSVWFHRPFRIDDWCLVTQSSPVTAGGRGFGLGHVFDADGRLVASFAQESMIRPV
jgi:acyl-CoA thioesterase-2